VKFNCKVFPVHASHPRAPTALTPNKRQNYRTPRPYRSCTPIAPSSSAGSPGEADLCHRIRSPLALFIIPITRIIPIFRPGSCTISALFLPYSWCIFPKARCAPMGYAKLDQNQGNFALTMAEPILRCATAPLLADPIPVCCLIAPTRTYAHLNLQSVL
jgi:hypothetical protein